ncbi:MAG: DUF3352 domain-containing protein [Opitutaceae bacterium]
MMTFRSCRAAALFAAVCLVYPVLRSAPALTRLVPEDAAVVISLRKGPEFATAMKASPPGRMFADEQVLRFFGPLRAKLNWEQMMGVFKEGTGTTWDDMLSWVEGDGLVVLNDFSFMLDPETQNRAPVVLALEVGKNAAKVEQVLTDLTAREVDAGRAQVETESFSGIGIHVLQIIKPPAQDTGTPSADADPQATVRTPPPLVWAVVDGVFLASVDKAAVIALVDAAKRGGVDAPLERAARWVRLQERADNPALSLMVHFPAILPTLEEALAKQSGGDAPNPMGIDTTKLIGTLGLDAWGDLYATLSSSEEATVSHYGLTATEIRGALKLFLPSDGTFPKPAWIPAQWVSVGTFRYSLKSAYETLESTLRAVSPAIDQLVQSQIVQLNKQLNLDLKRDLIGSLGDEVLQVQFPANAARAGAADQLYGFSLANAAAFTRALDELKKLGGPAMEKLLEKREYLGHSIYSSATPSPGGPTAMGLSYVVTDRWFLLNVGSAAPIEAALQAMAGQGDSFWDKPEVRAALATVPETASGFQFHDMAVLISSIFDSITTQAKSMPAKQADGEDGQGPWIEATEKPDLDRMRRYWGGSVNYSVRDAEGFHGVARLSHPQP